MRSFRRLSPRGPHLARCLIHRPTGSEVAQTKTPDTRGVPGVSFLNSPQLLVGRCAFRLPSGQSPVCTGDRPFSLAFQSTSDLRRRPISGSAFQPNLRLSSTVRSFQQVLQSVSSLRLQPLFEPSLPADLSTCVSDRPSP